MGWAGFNDDLNDIENDKWHEQTGGTITPPVAPVFDCPYCPKSFSSREELYAHIKNGHNITRPFLELNGKIADKAGTYHNAEITSLTLHMYGSSAPIFFNGEKVANVSDKSGTPDTVDLTKKATERFDTQGKLTIAVGDDEYSIIKYSYQSIKNPEIERIITDWGKQAENGKHINKNYPRKINEAEHDYLDSFFDYYTACVAGENEKHCLYESAYAILSKFDPPTPSACAVLQVIAFRFNWVSYLRTLCKGNRAFWELADFYANAPADRNYPSPKDFDKPDNCANSIFIEDGLDRCIPAVRNALSQNWDAVDNYLNNYADCLNISDGNLRDKVLLLLARRAVRNGKKQDARRFYEDIKSPFIEDERRDFMRAYKK